MANLNALGKSIAMYTIAHDDIDPPWLGPCVDAGTIASSALVCPAVRHETSFGDEEGLRQFMARCCDYVYIPAGSAELPGDLLRAFELPWNHQQRGTGVLFRSYCVHAFSQEGEDFARDFMTAVQRTNDALAEARKAAR